VPKSGPEESEKENFDRISKSAVEKPDLSDSVKHIQLHKTSTDLSEKLYKQKYRTSWENEFKGHLKTFIRAKLVLLGSIAHFNYNIF